MLLKKQILTLKKQQKQQKTNTATNIQPQRHPIQLKISKVYIDT